MYSSHYYTPHVYVFQLAIIFTDQTAGRSSGKRNADVYLSVEMKKKTMKDKRACEMFRSLTSTS